MALRGHVDRLSRRQVIGWARDTAAPDSPVALVVVVDGRAVGRCLAEQPRDDLVAAGEGHGRHGFTFAFPHGTLPALACCTVSVRREGDGAAVPGSPLTLDPITRFDADLREWLSLVLADPVDALERGRRLAFLLEQAQHLRRAAAEDPGLALDPVARPRALVIDTTLPVTARDAGSNAILSHLRSLQRLGYAVTFAPLDMVGDAAALEAEGVRCCLSPWYATVEEVLRRHEGAFAVVYLHRIETAGRYAQLVRDTQRGARLIYSVADLHHLRTARQAAVEGRADLAAYAEHVRLLELCTAQMSDAVITHSTHEAEILAGHIPSERVHIVPWAVAPRPTAVPFAARRGMAFVGGFGHQPNVDAALVLIESVMPALAALRPGGSAAELPCLLAGSGMPERVAALAAARPGVEILGRVPDLAALFDRVRLSVAPLAYGAGVKGKVLDSLAAGIPCVCTPVAAEGLDLPEPLARLVADTPTALAQAILSLHEDEGLNRTCAAAGLAYIAAMNSARRVDAGMRAALDLPNAEPTNAGSETSYRVAAA
ncbi:glycosyltransferase family 4 protein [Methylobacterium sp. E-005]|uniref:glycosyltransferase n=1 Tax=Methylobacterium sp. E-005 TaxID=2836549 RepID=UPI001FB8AEB9|nr:glycosyltransferase family 4 protein [Methylobacterium sp. E-005]MCJ2088232.1 glycosyltransferase family 4 protein [Methylobacterium sp. E-005]